MIENAGGNRDSNHVVEKCKSKILLDVANGDAAQFSRAHDSPQVTLEKSDARTFNRHIRPRAHGYAHVRRSQCRRVIRSEEHTSELQSHLNLVCRLLLEKKKKTKLRSIAQK